MAANAGQIIVIGAGIGGLATALALQRRGFRVAVYERAPEIREIGAGVVIAPNARRALRDLGVDAALEAMSCSVSVIHTCDYRTGEIVRTNCNEQIIKRQGMGVLQVHRADLHALLMEAVRANDPTALLSSDWATRQTTLQDLKNDGTLWSTYGATTADYNNAYSILSSHGRILGNPTGAGNGYVTSQESRTIWVDLSAAEFQNLFGTQLLQSNHKVNGETLYYWNGSLSAPTGLNVAGLWFDTAPWFGTEPAVSDLSGGAVVVPKDGPLSIGNYLSLI